jgi:hypothetical protein
MTKKNEQDVLAALLSVGDAKPTKEFTMKRFGVDFELQAIDGNTVNRMREQATFVTKKGKEFDDELFGALIIEKGCNVPNWNDKKLIEKYGSSDKAITSILLAGEIAKLSGAILELSGFADDEEDEIKN